MKSFQWLSLALVGGLFIWWLLRPAPGTPVQTALATVGTIQSYVEEEGVTRLPHIYQITMPLQGRVMPIEWQEGDCVNQGQVIAQLDRSDLDTSWIEASNTVKRYSKNLEQVDLAIQQAEQTVVASQEKYRFLEDEFARTKKLFERNTASESERNQAELRMIEARTELRKDELNRSMYEIGRSMLELMRDTEQAKQAQVERDRERTKIVSPVTGTILTKVVSNERVLQAGAVLLEIGDPETWEVEADFLSQDAVEMEVGDQAHLEGASIGSQPVMGQVTRIFPQGFTKISSLGVEQQRVKVIVGLSVEARARLAAEKRTLGVDYRVHVKVFTESRPQALIVPRTALFRSEQGDWQVFTVQGGVAKLVTVQLGIRNPFQVEIVDGLTAGDIVVVAPEAGLADGQYVESAGSAMGPITTAPITTAPITAAPITAAPITTAP